MAKEKIKKDFSEIISLIKGLEDKCNEVTLDHLHTYLRGGEIEFFNPDLEEDDINLLYSRICDLEKILKTTYGFFSGHLYVEVGRYHDIGHFFKEEL